MIPCSHSHDHYQYGHHYHDRRYNDDDHHSHHLHDGRHYGHDHGDGDVQEAAVVGQGLGVVTSGGGYNTNPLLLGRELPEVRDCQGDRETGQLVVLLKVTKTKYKPNK